MRLGVQTFSFRDMPMDEMFDVLRSLGVHFIEPHWQPEREIFMEGFSAPAVGVRNLTTHYESSHREMEFASLVKAETINVELAPGALPVAMRLMKEFDINVAIHNHGLGHRYPGWKRVYDVTAGTPVGLCLDIGHCMRAGEDPMRAVPRLGEKLYSVHLKDVDEDLRDVPIGSGVFPTVDFLTSLEDHGFKGLLAIEWEGQKPQEKVKQAIDFIMAGMNVEL